MFAHEAGLYVNSTNTFATQLFPVFAATVTIWRRFPDGARAGVQSSARFLSGCTQGAASPAPLARSAGVPLYLDARTA